MKKENKVPAIFWNKEYLEVLDQRLLPQEEIIIKVSTIDECFNVIRDMAVRGAPLIGFTAIWGMVIWLQKNKDLSCRDFEKAVNYLMTSRPTAINLEYELVRCKELCLEYEKKNGSLEDFYEVLELHCEEQMNDIYKHNLRMAEIAEKELDQLLNKPRYNIMTLCNTGYLACGPMGTALGVVEHLSNQSKIGKVYACETRPYLQGARLTSYELKKLNIDHDIVVEGAMSYILNKGLVDAIFVGADRIAGNGDTANKIGTSTLSIISDYYNIPFFVVAPTSSFDLSLEIGAQIPIELRDQNEIHYIKGTRITPENTTCLNPSFDISVAKNITGIICQKGLISPVNNENLKRVLEIGK